MEWLIRSFSALLEQIICFIIQTEFRNNIPVILNQQRTINFLVFFPTYSCCVCMGSSVSICHSSKYDTKQRSSRQEHLPVPYCVHLSASWLMFTSFDHNLVWFGSLSHRRLPTLGYHPCMITQYLPILGRGCEEAD